MPILQDDIKIFKSEAMNDLDHGGGQSTGDQVISGQSNQIFNDISTLDRTYSAVHLRKVYGAINTQTTDLGYGSHAIIAKIPTDEKIGITMFNTGDWFDRRTDAVNRMENYLGKGTRIPTAIWGTQFQGSKVVTVFQHSTAKVVGVGEVMVLVDKINNREQFIRVSEALVSAETLVDALGEFVTTVVQYKITDPLLHDYIGINIERFYQLDNAPCIIHRSIVVDAGKYYGSKPITKPLLIGDSVIKLKSIFNQLVPSAQSESSVLDVKPNGEVVLNIEGSSTTITQPSFNANGIVGDTFWLDSPFAKGSLICSTNAGVASDNGNGQLVRNSDGVILANLDYNQGRMTLTISVLINNAEFIPAGTPTKLSDSINIPITQGNRGFIYTANIKPIPEPETVKLSYLSGGDWFELYDDGEGNLTNTDVSIGQASVNFVSGSIAITLGYLPDVNSVIIISFGTKSEYVTRTNLTPDSFGFRHTLINQGVQPDSVVLTWFDGTARTASAGLDGQITGDGHGWIDLASDTIRFTPLIVPNKGTVVTMNYDFGAPIAETHSIFSTNGNEHGFTLTGNNIVAGSIVLKGTMLVDVILPPYGVTINQRSQNFVIKDNGLGGWVDLAGNVLTGSIDYVTGDCVISKLVVLALNIPTFQSTSKPAGHIPVSIGGTSGGGGGSGSVDIMGDVSNAPVNAPVTTGNTDATFSTIISTLAATFRTAAANAAAPETIILDEIRIDVTQGSDESIVPNSFLATYMENDYYDNAGFLYHSKDELTGAGTLAGSINYDTGKLTITNWTGGLTNTGFVKSLIIDNNIQPLFDLTIRVKEIPVKPEGFTIRAVPVFGNGEVQATADASGIIRTANFDGYIDVNTGIAFVKFGELVLAAGNELEAWYDAGSITADGYIIKPKPVYASTVVYNASSVTRLPLQSSIIGMSPVRLPIDGRVPVYKVGDMVVLINNQTNTGVYLNNQVVTLGRTGLSKITVADSGGNVLPVGTYTVDLNLGQVTFLDISAISKPITITDRIEDMAVVNDTQVNGFIGLTQPLTHDYPILGTLVCNAVIYGDKQAYFTPVFDQETWSGVWSDNVIGNTVLAEYNDTQYPIIVDNASCVTEDWLFLFQNATTYQIIGKNLGVIALGDTTSDSAPINPVTNQPYFTLKWEGWGSGWSAGNVLRSHSEGAGMPLWLIQAISQGQETDPDYNFCIEVRMDRDAV